MFAGDIQVRFKWVIRYWRCCAYGGDICPIKLHTRYMRRAALAMKSRREHEQEIDELIEEQLHRMKEKDEHATE